MLNFFGTKFLFVSCDIKPGYRTDHSLVDIKFDFNQMDRGVGYWKFNNSLLTDKVFVDQVKNIIGEIVKTYAVKIYHMLHPRDIQFTINDQLFFRCF